MMFCQKEEIDQVLGVLANHKGASDHHVSTEWTTVNRSSFSEYFNKVFTF